MSTARALPLLVAIETDPLRYHGEHAVTLAPCTAADAEQLLAHVASDLAKLFPEWIPRSAREGLPAAAWRRLLSSPLRSSHPLELFRGTRSRTVQLYLAAVLLERPHLLPWWLLHRARRGGQTSDNPLDPGPPVA